MSASRQITDDQIQQARSRLDLIAAEVALKPMGRELAGLCPFHNEKTPSFYVVPEKGFFHCFGCGAHGDPIGFVMRLRGLGFVDAVAEMLGLPQQRARSAPAAAGNPAAQSRAADRSKEIAEILNAAGEVTMRTAAGLYLFLRGLPVHQLALRAHPALYCHEVGAPLPALIAPLTNSADKVTAVQRIWLSGDAYIADGTKKDNRADLQARKKTLGPMGDGAVRLRPAGRVLGLAEGVETAIAAMKLDRGVPVWAVCGLSRLGSPETDRAPSVWIPPFVELLKIYGDNGIGKGVAEAAANWWRRQGIAAETVMPDPSCDDFNTMLMAMEATA